MNPIIYFYPRHQPVAGRVVTANHLRSQAGTAIARSGQRPRMQNVVIRPASWWRPTGGDAA